MIDQGISENKGSHTCKHSDAKITQMFDIENHVTIFKISKIHSHHTTAINASFSYEQLTMLETQY